MIGRLAVGVVASLAGVLPLGALVAIPDASADTPSLRVVVDSLVPAVPTATGTLRISGRVVNTSQRTIEGTAVRLRIGREPLAADTDLAALLGGGPASEPASDPVTDPAGEAVPQTGTLAPGDQRAFTVQVPVTDLRRPANGVYPVGVEAVSGPGRREGIEWTALPLLPPTTPSVGVVWLWPLAEQPARDASGVFVDDRLPLALATDGRLTRLLASGSAHRSEITWVMDPELLEAVHDIANGYQVLRGDEVVIGDHAAEGERWLRTLERATEGQTVHVLPYADVDAPASRRAGLQDDVVRSVTIAEPLAEELLGRPVTGGLAWAPSGRYDRRTTDLLATAGVRTMVLDASALPTGDSAFASGVGELATGIGPVDAVLIDPTLSAILTGPQATASEIVRARQRFLAHTALVAQASTEPLIVVAAPSSVRWDPAPQLVDALLTATARAPWLRPASLGQLLGAPRPDRNRARYRSEDRSAELAPSYLRQVVRVQGSLAELTAVVDDPLPAALGLAAALLRTQSATWRTSPTVARRLLRTVSTEIDGRIDLVRVLSTGTVTFSGDSGRVPVTIANDGDTPVTVGLKLIGQPMARLVSPALNDITVDPGRKVSVEVDARVLGAEPVTVRVQLLTPRGQTYGRPARITITSTAYARAAAWVMGVAFAGIAVFVVIGVARRIRKARQTPASATGHTQSGQPGSGTVST